MKLCSSAAVGEDEVKKQDGKEVEGIFGFGKKDKDKEEKDKESKDKDKVRRVIHESFLIHRRKSKSVTETPTLLIPIIYCFYSKLIRLEK